MRFTCSIVAVTCLLVAGCLDPEAAKPKYSVPKYGQAKKTDQGPSVAKPRKPRVTDPAVNFRNFDQDRNERLTLAEFLPKRGAPDAVKRSEDIFKLCDRNGDGELTLAEFTTKPPQAEFRRKDLDGNGSLRPCKRITYRIQLALRPGVDVETA